MGQLFGKLWQSNNQSTFFNDVACVVILNNFVIFFISSNIFTIFKLLNLKITDEIKILEKTTDTLYMNAK